MKRLSIIILLMFLYSIASQAQKPYSVGNLEKLSHEDLNTYLDKAQKLQKTGKTITKVGGITLGAGVLTGGVIALSVEDSGMISASIIILSGIAGLSTLLVGIPMNITGKERAERINTIKNTAYDGIKIDLKPCAQYNLASQNHQPGIALRIRF